MAGSCAISRRRASRLPRLGAGLLAFSLALTSLAASPTIDDLGWIAGTWQGELFGSHAEERWTAPAAGHMLGVFRLWSDRGPGVYELLEIRQEPGEGDDPDRVLLRFRHFHPGALEPWEKEDPLEFLLESVGDHRAVFKATSEEQRVVTSMVYSRQGDALTVNVEGEHEDGEAFAFTAHFDLQRD